MKLVATLGFIVRLVGGNTTAYAAKLTEFAFESPQGSTFGSETTAACLGSTFEDTRGMGNFDAALQIRITDERELSRH